LAQVVQRDLSSIAVANLIFTHSMQRFVVVAGLCATSLALRRKSKHGTAKLAEEEAVIAEIQDASTMVSHSAQHRSSTRVWREADCDELANITVRDRRIGGAVAKLCKFWPKSKFGEFPVENVGTVVSLFNGAGGLWDKVKGLAKKSNTPFCWKKLGMRENLGSPGSVKPEFCEKKVLGKCFGTCPDGMKPMTLVGALGPVCSSSCMQSSHKTPCGFGCATGAGTCLRQVKDQFSVVVRNLGQAAGYIVGNAAVSEVVDKVLRLIDFAIDVVFDVVKMAKDVWKNFPREQMRLGLVLSLLQFVLEHAKTIGSKLVEFNGMFGETMEMVMSLADGEFEMKEINLGFISNTIMGHGAKILNAANEFADAFVFPRCKVTAKTNADYDCDGDGYDDCKDWSYAKARCKENEGKCKYKFKFGDMRLKNSCRCKNRR